MGRKLRRVPLDFNWPIDEIWEGYINPHWQHRRECEMCQGSGYGPDGFSRLFEEEYGQSLTLAEAEAALLAAQPVNGRGNGKGKG